MNSNRVKEILEYVKGFPETMDYGKWGALNPEQRKIIKELCNSWLILDEATNMQTKEIERLQSIINEVRKYIANSFITGDEIFRIEILEILDKGSID